MKYTDQYYIKKVLSILHGNDIEATKQMEQTIEMLHIYLQSNKNLKQDLPAKVINFRNAVCRNNHPDPRSLPGR
ncbi:Glycoside hydrolase family 4 [Candidatus Scalindua japonica]|uniref:Glycoside hydrolase family 4 n=1 Tax=Candidatus Scalindua japonica TaxID=1284222 RepID=A0A286TVT8_9BACT|nr:Glycoside hydrolase family 4 [Candidatus Scalindua japonica]